MKLEKREITLNEKDSVNDVKYIEKHLLLEYAERAEKLARKQSRAEITRLMKEVAEDMWFARDLANGLEEKDF